MSNTELAGTVNVCGGESSELPVLERIESRPVVLTPRTWDETDGRDVDPAEQVHRYLPTKGRRMVGAWCFLDLFGPSDVSAGHGMQIAPHPHCGLQTVTWLLAGNVRHRDSLGSDQLIEPGQLNLMTAGHGIAHAENSPAGHGPALHGVQLWVALPGPERERLPGFAHHHTLPAVELPGIRGVVLLGELAGIASPATAYTPIVGADLELAALSRGAVPVRPEWEYAVLVIDGDATVAGSGFTSTDMVYLGCGRSELELSSHAGARLLLLGGAPFEEEIVMWWNFVARSHDEIAAARSEWTSGDRFGVVEYDGSVIPAPPLPPVTLRPRGRS